MAWRYVDARREAARSPHEPPPPALPDLAQVTGWTKASASRRMMRTGRSSAAGGSGRQE
jgi:hypothetical protein